MGRKGDIISKVIGVRAPIKTYTKLLNDASDKGVSLSEYCVSLLNESKPNYNPGGQTEIDLENKYKIIIQQNRELNSELNYYKHHLNLFSEHYKDKMSIDVYIEFLIITAKEKIEEEIEEDRNKHQVLYLKRYFSIRERMEEQEKMLDKIAKKYIKD